MKLAQTVIAMIALTVVGASATVQAADIDEILILDGFVRSVDWSGEQLIVVFHSNDGYEGADWTITGPKPADLLHMGWSKDLLKANDRIDAYIYPDRDGETKGTLKRFILADGSTLEASLHSDLDMAPRAALYRVFDDPADDPMAGFYGNTSTCLAMDTTQGASQYNCTVWTNADHTFTIFENNLYSEGGQGKGLIMQDGIWWLEMQRPGQWTKCVIITGGNKPRCHSPVIGHKSGDQWSIPFHGRNADWTEYRTIQEGRQ